MSDILIKNMDMPKSCEECALYDEDYCECRRETDLLERTMTRENGCPLVEVKPHGRLIDIDKLKKDAFEKGVDVALTLRDEGTVIACTAIPLKQFFDLMDEQPTVLEVTE